MARRLLSTSVILLSVTGTALTAADHASANGFVDVNGVHTYYERHGRGDPMVLLHGAVMVAEARQPQVEAFASDFTVYVPERRGVGRTADIDGAWTYAGMMADTAAFMDALEIRGAVVIGVSDGGIIGLLLAEQRPDLVGRLVVSGVNINPDAMGDFAEFLRHLSSEDFFAGTSTHAPELMPWIEIHRRVSPDHGRDLVATFGKMKSMWLDFEITPAQLGRIAAPTLVMAEDHDTIPLAHTVMIQESIPDARLHIAPDADHFWVEKQAAVANRIIRNFLKDAGPAAER